MVLQILGNELAVGQSVGNDYQSYLDRVFQRGGLSVNSALSVTLESPGVSPRWCVLAHESISAMKQQILIIDDDRSVRQALRLLLEHHGFGCMEADDGIKGLALLDAGFSVSMIFSDFHMPVMNGVSFLRALLSRVSAKKVPVILLSGDVTNEMVKDAKEAGAFAVMTKPYDPQQILAAVARACT